MAGEQKYAPPTSPPPNYATPKPQHQDAGPYPNPTSSPAPGPYNQMAPFPQQGGDMRAPDPAYGGYHGGNYGGPQQGPYGQPAQGYYAPGPNQPGGYYGQPMPQQQGMYYQQGPPVGYYGNDRGGSGSGICAGIMGALACCCCLDLLF